VLVTLLLADDESPPQPATPRPPAVRAIAAKDAPRRRFIIVFIGFLSWMQGREFVVQTSGAMSPV